MVPDKMISYDDHGCLHDMFRRQASETPDAIAIVAEDEGKKITFRQLDELTNILAVHLQHLGVVPDSSVGIYLPRCSEYVIAYIAILKAGGAYMPIDISYPRTLLESIFEDAEPVTVCTTESLSQSIVDLLPELVLLDADWADKLSRKNLDLPPLAAPKLSLDNLAYTVYSSGTTGKPKGIQCPHRGAVFSYVWRHANYPYQPDDREASNIFFVWEMLRPLLKGIPMYIIPDTIIYDPKELCDFLSRNKITRILLTPSLFEAVIETRQLDLADSFRYMRQVWFNGEVVTTALLKRGSQLLPSVRFINLYSTSESHDTAVCDLTHELKNDPGLFDRMFCPVGRPLQGVHILVLDEDNRAASVGVAGEILIGGPTLARGYLNRPQVNAQRFITRPNGISSDVGDRLYRTGDWGYILSDGSLEICGRCDSMVKIRGYSIEVQAIEAGLLELPTVNKCNVLVHGKEGEDKFLVAYIVPVGQATRKEIRAGLKLRLPFYMIPSYFVLLSSIPIVAATGKLDKSQLPAVENMTSELDADSRPSTSTEIRLAAIWAEVLSLRSVDIHESFFDMGGHSLLAAKFLDAVHEEFGVQVSVQDLFSYSTVASFAQFLDDNHNGKATVKLLKLDLLAEVKRHDQAFISNDMQLRAFWRAVSIERPWNRGEVLLTGATGFLGAFLLRDLLKHTKVYVHCLVRDTPEHNDIRQRLEANLKSFGILGSEEEIQRFQSRVGLIKGDVSLMNLGLSDGDYLHLSYAVDYIIHAAASVNLIYPYKALHGANVFGTENIIAFACFHKIKPLHYISTNAVFPHGVKQCNENADMEQYANQLHDGYSQSKWVAEQLVLTAKNRGLPVSIYRLGNLAGDSQQGYWNPLDFTLLMIRGCIDAGLVPTIDWNIEMTPVNFVSEVIVSLTQNIRESLSKIFHIVNPKTVSLRWLTYWLKSQGYELESVSFSDWISHIKALQQKNQDNKELELLCKLLDGMVRDGPSFPPLSSFNNDNFMSALTSLERKYPTVGSELLQMYVRSLAERGVIEKPNKIKPKRLLVGKVAVVTGASSGIGAGIALHLAREGALVALAARRIDKLLETQKQIESEGGVAVTVETDVTRRDDVKKLISKTEEMLGPVDILVNNAGIMYYTLMSNLHQDEWEKQVDINCKGVLNSIGAVLGSMLQRGQGHIVNISSDAGRKAFPGLAVYSGTKFFVEGVSSALRQEIAKSGVKVTCIQPGDCATELLQHTTDTEAKSQFDGSSCCKILEVDDIARAVVFAVSQPPHVGINEILIEPREAPV